MSSKWFDNKFLKRNTIKWILIVSCVTGVVFILYYFSSLPFREKSALDSNLIELINDEDSLAKYKKFSSEKSKTFRNPKPCGKGVQKIELIVKENADRFTPILIKDTIIFSQTSPNGYGNQLEFSNNHPNDQFYFEKEHNTVWYKFISGETGQLTFDIIPINIDDDYDFMLFQFNGKDFFEKVINKQIKPVRTCISRNNKNLKSMRAFTE